MKKCILIVNWLKWNLLKLHRSDLVYTHSVQAYPGHYGNLFDYDEILIQYLKEKDIEYHINICDYHFKNKSTKTTIESK
jgi:hypothetical protein